MHSYISYYTLYFSILFIVCHILPECISTMRADISIGCIS